MVHVVPLKNVSGQSYKATIRTFGSSLVARMETILTHMTDQHQIELKKLNMLKEQKRK